MKKLFIDFLLPFILLKNIFSYKRLLSLSIVPSILTIILLIFSQISLWGYLRTTGFLNFIFSLMALSISSIVIWVILGNILLVPFIDAIIDASQKRAVGFIFLKSLPFSFTRMLKEIGYALIIIVILLLSIPIIFIPVIGQVIGPVIGMWALSFNALAPMFERNQIDFKHRFKYLNRIWPSTISYGAGLWILLYIPIVNIFLLGLAQASAVDFWLKHEQSLKQ